MINEPLDSKKIQVKLFGGNAGLEVEQDINNWLKSNDVKVHDLQLKYCEFATSPGEMNPSLEYGFLGVIIFSKKVKARILP